MAKSIKVTKKKLNLEKALAKEGFVVVAKRALISEIDHQNTDNTYVNIRALKHDMKALGHQDKMVIEINAEGDDYVAKIYLPKDYK